MSGRTSGVIILKTPKVKPWDTVSSAGQESVVWYYKSFRNSSDVRLRSCKIPERVPFLMSLDPWRDTSVRLPSWWENTRCDAPRSGCSTKPNFFRTRISLLEFILGDLGMRHALGLFRSGYRFKKLHPRVLRNRLAVCEQTAQVNIDGIAHHGACLIYRFAPGVATGKSRDGYMKSALVGLYKDAVRVAHASNYSILSVSLPFQEFCCP